MNSNIAKIIADCREKCVQLQQNAPLDSDEKLACSLMLPAFDRFQTGEPAHRAKMIIRTLEQFAANTRALPLNTPEAHLKAVRAKAIIRQWAIDLQRETS